jgi:hypothetical protein
MNDVYHARKIPREGWTVKFEELEPARQLEVRRILDDQVAVIRGQVFNAGSEARRFLFFVNAGGAVALLSFMGTQEAVRKAPIAWLALGLFFLGLVAVGALQALNWHQLSALQRGYANDMRAALMCEIDLLEFDQRRQKVAHWLWVPLSISYAAAAFFLVGSGIAIFGLMPPI